MKIKVYNCEGENYSEHAIESELSHQILDFNGKKIEVELDCSPMIFGQSKGVNDVNLMFKDLDTSKEENERKYFTKVNWLKKQRIKWMFGKHYLQGLTFIQAFGYPFVLLILGGLITWIVNYQSNKQFDEIEIISHQIHSGNIVDTLDIRVRNLGTRTSVLNSIDINFIKSWELERDNKSHYDFLEPSKMYDLGNFSNQLEGVKNSKSKTLTKSVSIAQDVKSNQADRFLISINNLELSNLALFNIRLNFNKNDFVETDNIMHVFTQEIIDNYPFKKEGKIISNLLIRDYMDLSIDTLSPTQKSEIEERIKQKSKPIQERINLNRKTFKDAISYTGVKTEKFEKYEKEYTKE